MDAEQETIMGGDRTIQDAFDLDEEEALLEYFKEHGVVVVRDILNEDEVCHRDQREGRVGTR